MVKRSSPVPNTPQPPRSGLFKRATKLMGIGEGSKYNPKKARLVIEEEEVGQTGSTNDNPSDSESIDKELYVTEEDLDRSREEIKQFCGSIVEELDEMLDIDKELAALGKDDDPINLL